jgi:hypothetical protein
MQNHGDWEECGKTAAAASSRKLPGPLFEQEALRMRGMAAWHTGDKQTARAAFAHLARVSSPGRAREAEDWLDLVR